MTLTSRRIKSGLLDYEELLKSEKLPIPSVPPKSPTDSSKEEALDVSLHASKVED